MKTPRKILGSALPTLVLLATCAWSGGASAQPQDDAIPPAESPPPAVVETPAPLPPLLPAEVAGDPVVANPKEDVAFPAFKDAQEPTADAAVAGAPSGPRIVFGATAGYAIGTLRHPELIRTSFDGAMLELHVGVAIRPALTVAFELTSVELEVRRGPVGLAPKNNIVPSSLRIQAESTRASTSTNGLGGAPYEYPVVHLHTIGPRVEFTPFGTDGLYLGGTAGAGVVQDLPSRVGGAAAARGGYRVRVADVIGFSFEAGAHAHVYKDGSSFFPFAGVQMRLFLPGFGTK